jgi:CubicO group peptidase (beta-lactamase class C family)/D-alanyl-D-alanine dipeptidase
VEWSDAPTTGNLEVVMNSKIDRNSSQHYPGTARLCSVPAPTLPGGLLRRLSKRADVAHWDTWAPEIRRGTRAVGGFLALLIGACAADDAGFELDRVDPPSRYAEVVESTRQLIRQEMAQKDLPALSIALVDDQELVWAEGFGFETLADSVPATSQTVYRVGSVSKLFTDIAVMQLVERGLVDLDAPITEYLPIFQPDNPSGMPITLRQLMSHRSGLVREPPVGHYFDDSEPTIAATVSSLSNTRLVYEPEDRAKYSNAGIAVVGRVIEEVAGSEFASHLEREVLTPLGMRTSAFEPIPTVTRRLAEARMWTQDGRTFAAPGFQLGMAPAGSMYSTVHDLGRFMSALFAGGMGEGGRILEEASLEEMWRPQYGTPETQGGIGLGFILGTLDGHRSVGHGGAIYGFATELLALPEEKLGVVAVTSVDMANTVVGRIAAHALRGALASRDGRPLPELVTTEPLPAESAERLEGRYVDGEGNHLADLIELGGRLFHDPVRGGTRAEVRTRGDTLVIDDRRAFGTRFLPVDGALLTPDQRYVRRATPRPASAPPRWEGLIGEYGWDHNVLYILEEGGRLNALIEWFFRYPLVEEGPDAFRFPTYGLYDNETLVFQRDERGRAVRVVLAGSVVWERRTIDGEGEATFKIDAVRPVSELRAAALEASPPAEEGEFRESHLVDLTDLDPTIRLDIRYASRNNFMDAAFYDEPRALLQRPAAEAVVRAHQSLRDLGYGLLIHDGYRPWYVTKMFWDATPQEQKLFVADPASGSRHNRGAAVDLTLYDLATGEPVTMVSGYDEFSDRAFPDYPGGTARQRWLREVLREAMEDQGFTVYEWEWWHFDYGDWREYAIQNLTFDRVP